MKTKSEVSVGLALWGHMEPVNPGCGYCCLQFENEVCLLIPYYSIDDFRGSFCFCSESEKLLFHFDWMCILF